MALAQATASAYQTEALTSVKVLPDTVGLPAKRHRMVTTRPRVTVLSGPNCWALMPLIRPCSKTYFTASAYQALAATSANVPSAFTVGLPDMAYRVWASMARLKPALGANSRADTPDMMPFSATYSTAL